MNDQTLSRSCQYNVPNFRKANMSIKRAFPEPPGTLGKILSCRSPFSCSIYMVKSPTHWNGDPIMPKTFFRVSVAYISFVALSFQASRTHSYVLEVDQRRKHVKQSLTSDPHAERTSKLRCTVCRLASATAFED